MVPLPGKGIVAVSTVRPVTELVHLWICALLGCRAPGTPTVRNRICGCWHVGRHEPRPSFRIIMVCLDFTSCIACRHPSETSLGQQALLLITSAMPSSASLPKQRHPLTKAGHATAILRADS